MNALSRETFDFMGDLWKNNSRKWFDDNRQRYEDHVRKPLKLYWKETPVLFNFRRVIIAGTMPADLIEQQSGTTNQSR